MDKNLSAFDHTVYNICFPQRDNIVLFHGPFYEVRKKYFENKKAASKSGMAYISGVESSFSAKIGLFSASYELKSEGVYLQRLYKEKGGYCVVTRDYLGSILSKSNFSNKHIWLKTSYYDNGNVSRPSYVFTYEEGGVIMLEYDKAQLSYIKYPLYFVPAVTGSKENSLLDSKFGKPVFYIAAMEGDFAFYSDLEAAKGRSEMQSELEKSDHSPVWDDMQENEQLWNPLDETDIGENYRYIGEKNENGERHGRGRTEQLSGITAYEGDYVCGKRDGKGACYYEDGVLSYYGGFRDGKKNGAGVSVKKGFEGFHVGSWSGGKLLGMSATFDERGVLKSVGYASDKSFKSLKFELFGDRYFIGKETENGNMKGSIFDLDGTLIYSGEYKNGKYNSRGVLFAPNGAVIMQGVFKDGIFVEKK